MGSRDELACLLRTRRPRSKLSFQALPLSMTAGWLSSFLDLTKENSVWRSMSCRVKEEHVHMWRSPPEEKWMLAVDEPQKSLRGKERLPQSLERPSSSLDLHPHLPSPFAISPAVAFKFLSPSPRAKCSHVRQPIKLERTLTLESQPSSSQLPRTGVQGRPSKPGIGRRPDEEDSTSPVLLPGRNGRRFE